MKMHDEGVSPVTALLCSAILLFLPVAAFGGGAPPTVPIYVIANADIGFPTPNEIELFTAQGNQLTFQDSIYTGGFGIQGGFFGTSRVNSTPSLTAPCVYVSDAGSNDIASLSLQDLAFTGTFTGSESDDGSANGIGMAVNANYLYASYTASQTIGVFALHSGCSLSFLGDVKALGRHGGTVTGMAASRNMLVVAYGDGSIQSFNIANGMPVSNNDLQDSTGFGGGGGIGPSATTGALPTAVDISQDGRFAIFGDIAPATMVEVSNLATGKLGATVAYSLGTNSDAGSIRLSPDQSLLYITNNESGTVTAAFFNASTGRLSRGCVSAPLRGFNTLPWYGSVVPRDTVGTGNLLYVVEFGRPFVEINHGPASQIGMLAVTSTGTSCTLTETSTSPASLIFTGALSLGVYPPRAF